MLTIRSIIHSLFFTAAGFCLCLACQSDPRSYASVTYVDRSTAPQNKPAVAASAPATTQPDTPPIHPALTWNVKDQVILAASQLKQETAKLAGFSVKTEIKKANQALVIAKEAVVERKKGQELDRLWLQSYNAGPGSLLRYRGNVPYRETRTYVKKVMTYYDQDLSGNPYDEKIRTSAKQFNLDPQMIRAIAKAESDFNPRCVSSAGARGVMQVMGCTWAHAKKVANIPWSYGQDVFDPQKNIYVACAYLSWLRHDFIPQNANKLGFTPPQIMPKTHAAEPKAVSKKTKSRRHS